MLFLPIYQRRRRQDGEICYMFVEIFFSDPLNPFICAISRQNPHRHRVLFNGDMVNLLPMLLVAYTSVLGKSSQSQFHLYSSALTISMTESKSKTGKAIEIDPRVGQLGNQDKKVRTASA